MSIYPVIVNNGPCDAENIVEVSVKAESNEIFQRNISYPDQAYLTPGFVSPVYANSATLTPITLTAAEMNSMGLAGTFTITFTARYQGVDTDTTNNTATLTVTRGDVGIAEHGQNIAVSLYPNPTNDILNIETISEIENITICDISGHAIRQWNNVEQLININDLANGIYLVKIKMKEGEIVRKIVKQ